MVSNRKNWTEDEFIIAVRSSHTIAEVLRKLNLRPVGGNYTTFNHYVDKLNLDTSHFTGQAHAKGKTCGSRPKISLSAILVEGSTYRSYHLKHRLLREGYLSYHCSGCGLSTWMGAPISLHLDHINGVNSDNRLDNLRLLCPNCHSQTPTYCRTKVD